jgi:hypothetical protein
MEANMQHCTSNILPICDQIFNQDFCHELAWKHRFIQRSSSKIQGHELIKALILPSNGLSEDSLDGLCLRLKAFNPEVDISASALAQRINTASAVELMKACMQKILNTTRDKLVKQYSCLEGCLSLFNNIYIQDSTVFEINKKLSKFYKGTKRGGKKGQLSCKAQVKIDLIHNLAIGSTTDAQIYEGKRPDQALTGRILKIIKKGDLVLRDLGYFKIEVFQRIAKLAAFFLTRFPSHVTVYLNKEDKEPINLAMHLDKYYNYSAAISINVWVGAERLPVRLVAYRVPKSIQNERLRKARKCAKEMGRTLSKAKLDLLQFSLFITNIPEELVSTKMIGTIYRLRWEIELIFKQWKSLLKIDVLKGVCRYRVEALIWGRLCMAVLVAAITATFMNLANKYCAGELSPTKMIEYLIRNGKLCEAVKQQKIENLEKEIIQDMKKRLLKSKRSRLTMREKTIGFEAYYELGICV